MGDLGAGAVVRDGGGAPPAALLLQPRYPPGVDAAQLHASVRARCEGELARELKQSLGTVFEERAAAAPAALARMPSAAYTLPDGCRLMVGAARVAVPELIFDPSSSPAAAARFPHAVGLQDACAQAVLACEPEARRELLGSVVLTGGGSAFAGLPERLERELRDPACGLGGAAAGARPRVVPAAPDERAFGPWTGGSILASLGTFPDLWFSAGEYREHGAKGFARKII